MRARSLRRQVTSRMSEGPIAAVRSCTGRSWRPARRSLSSSQGKRSGAARASRSGVRARGISAPPRAPRRARRPGPRRRRPPGRRRPSSAAASAGNQAASRKRQAASPRASSSRRRAAAAGAGAAAPGQHQVGGAQVGGLARRHPGGQPERDVGAVGGADVEHGGAQLLGRQPERQRRRPHPARGPRLASSSASRSRAGSPERGGSATTSAAGSRSTAASSRRWSAGDQGMHRHPEPGGAVAHPGEPERRVPVADRHVARGAARRAQAGRGRGRRRRARRSRRAPRTAARAAGRRAPGRAPAGRAAPGRGRAAAASTGSMLVDELVAVEQRPGRGVVGLRRELQPVVVLRRPIRPRSAPSSGSAARARQAARKAFASGEILRKKKRSRVRT